MTQLAEGRKANQIQSPEYRLAPFSILDEEIVYPGGILAVDSTGEIQMASDAVGLRAAGFAECLAEIDNADDGEKVNAALQIRLYNNSATSALTRASIGCPAYVEDDNVVAGATTHYVAAGLVYDVTDDGVYVDQRPNALALARRLAATVTTAKTADYTILATEAWSGNRIFTASKAAGMTLTLPSAVPGMRVGIQRLTADATYDVSIQAAAGDTVLGSAAAKKVTNAVDAVSDILWLVAADDAAWIADNPRAGDLAGWVIDNT